MSHVGPSKFDNAIIQVAVFGVTFNSLKIWPFGDCSCVIPCAMVTPHPFDNPIVMVVVFGIIRCGMLASKQSISRSACC